MRFRPAHIIALLLILHMGCNEIELPAPSHTALTATIKLHAPKGTTAGSPIEVMLVTDPQVKVMAQLVVDNGLTISQIDCHTNEKLKINGTHFQRAGIYKLSAIWNSKLIAQRKMKIKPRAIAEEMQVLTGPTSILVNGLQESMVALIPQDSYDNPILEKKKIHYKTAEGRTSTPVNNLLSHYRFSSGEKIGKVLIGAAADGKANREQAIIQTAGWPQDFTIEKITHHPYADGRQYTRLRTSALNDKNGNTISDGTQVVFKQYDNNKLISSYKSITVDGIANVYMKNPDRAVKATVQAFIGPSKSQALSLEYKNNIQELKYEYDPTTYVLKVGPLQSMLNQYVPDGTEVTLRYKNKQKTNESIDGSVEFDLAALKSKDELTLKIEAGGITKIIKLW